MSIQQQQQLNAGIMQQYALQNAQAQQWHQYVASSASSASTLATYAVALTPEPVKTKEKTALQWLDSRVDEMRVRL